LFRCRALEIAVKHKTHVDTVLGFRERYMKKSNKEETNKKFLQFAQGVSIFSFKIGIIKIFTNELMTPFGKDECMQG